jgi:peroxiredoxin
MAELSIGDKAPAFELPDTEGMSHAFPADGERPTAIVFTCNHCPYALAWHDRILDVARDYEPHGVRMLLISPNDAQRYPRDSFEAMQQRVRGDGGWPAPYLYDESQEVARAYGAKTTPDVFVVDSAGTLRYRGAPDADHGDEAQHAAWLRSALEAVLEGSDPEPAETDPVGCSIKWR